MGRDVRAGPPLIQSDPRVPPLSFPGRGHTFLVSALGECLDAKDAALCDSRAFHPHLMHCELAGNRATQVSLLGLASPSSPCD